MLNNECKPFLFVEIHHTSMVVADAPPSFVTDRVFDNFDSRLL